MKFTNIWFKLITDLYKACLFQQLTSFLELTQDVKEETKEQEKKNNHQRRLRHICAILDWLFVAHFHVVPLCSSDHRWISSKEGNAPLLYLITVWNKTPSGNIKAIWQWIVQSTCSITELRATCLSRLFCFFLLAKHHGENVPRHWLMRHES